MIYFNCMLLNHVYETDCKDTDFNIIIKLCSKSRNSCPRP